jgi:hypothetical protein
MIWAILGLWSLAAFLSPPRLAEAIAPYHFIPGWRWYWWVIGALIVVLVWVFEGAYHHTRRLHEKLDGTPKLVCKGVSSHYQPISANHIELIGSPEVTTTVRRIIGNPVFYHLKIANEPIGVTDRKTAENVAARVQIFHESGTPAAKERLHRWEHSPGPAEGNWKTADTLIPIDIPPSGVEYKLDIAMKYDEDDAFYTPNNETVLNGSSDFREENFKFPPGTYIARVHLRGNNVASDLGYQIVNNGRGTPLNIKRHLKEQEGGSGKPQSQK